MEEEARGDVEYVGEDGGGIDFDDPEDELVLNFILVSFVCP